MTNARNVDPKALFGEDLNKVFGIKANRKHIRTFNSILKHKIIKKIPEYVNTDVLGDDPSLFDIANLCLEILEKCGALQGIDLDWFDDKLFQEKTLVRSATYVDVKKVVKNKDVQRGIQLRHLVKDILFNFDPQCVYTGIARFSKSKNLFYLNDAQHRFVACIILGIRSIPLDYIVSEYRSDDIKQYAAVNIRSLSASEFDKYRIKRQAVTAKKKEVPDINISDEFDDDFIKAYQLGEVLSAYGCKLIEKGSAEKTKENESTGVYNLLKIFSDYGEKLFIRALDINQRVFYKAPISSPNLLGICEFIVLQTEAEVGVTEIEMDRAIVDSLRHKYNPNRNGFYRECMGCFKDGEAKLYAVPEAKKIAAGVLKLVKANTVGVEWVNIIHGPLKLVEHMDEFKVPLCWNQYHVLENKWIRNPSKAA